MFGCGQSIYLREELMTEAKQHLRDCFHSLDLEQAVVSGEAATAYNAVSLTVGITDRWLWPGSSLESFDCFYRNLGFVPGNDGAIALWGLSPSNLTHVSISGAGHGRRWESKCGSGCRIQHGLDELAGSGYGRVLRFYRRSSLILEPAFAPLLANHANGKPKKPLSATDKKMLHDQLTVLPAKLRTRFEAAFSAWKKTWFAGGLAVSANPYSRAIGKEFDALVMLGPTMLPLLIEQLANPENFLALPLYDALQTNERLAVQFGPDDERVLEGEQGRARRVVQAWSANQ
jgi:hypothetical protein